MEALGLQESMLKIADNKINEISNINLKNKKNDELMKAAQDFEAVFINQFLNIIDSTIEREEMFSGGRGENMFRSMMYQELSKNISSDPSTSFGVAKQIYEQMQDLV